MVYVEAFRENRRFPKIIFTVGHSNRTVDEFIELLRKHEISILIDVRRFPKSKFSHFNGDELRLHLKKNGISYVFLGDLLGGFRREGYKVYMDSDAFRQGIGKLLEFCENYVCAIMCAERLYFKCHRRFISKYLEELGWRVVHI